MYALKNPNSLIFSVLDVYVLHVPIVSFEQGYSCLNKDLNYETRGKKKSVKMRYSMY